jgi:hypothetical protein
MLFLFIDYYQTQIFYQIFNNTHKYDANDSSEIYDLKSTNFIIIDEKYFLSNIKVKISILDNFISFNNLNTNKTYLFSYITTLIDNIHNKTIFKNDYTKINEHIFPNLIDNNYDNIFIINFKVYKINDNLFLINEICNDNITKQYFISTTLDELSNC